MMSTNYDLFFRDDQADFYMAYAKRLETAFNNIMKDLLKDYYRKIKLEHLTDKMEMAMASPLLQ